MLEARERNQEGVLRRNRRKATTLLWVFALVVFTGIAALAWRNRDLIQQAIRESKEKPKQEVTPTDPTKFTAEDVKLAKDVYQFLAPGSGKQATPAPDQKGDVPGK